MPDFPTAAVTYWNTLFGSDSAAFSVHIDAPLRDGRRVMLLQTVDGRERAAVAPALAERLSLQRQPCATSTAFRQRLADAGVALHGADSVFYFDAAAADTLPRHDTAGLRRLDAADAAAFAQFQAAASEQDLDDAYVELDHWAVFGAFVDDRLVCVGSAYPWDEAPIADLGVLTLAAFRGRGLARAVVHAIGRYARDAGYEPQYRCQHDNAASLALARAAGLRLFGHWDVIAADCAV